MKGRLASRIVARIMPEMQAKCKRGPTRNVRVRAVSSAQLGVFVHRRDLALPAAQMRDGFRDPVTAWGG
jgi:hypothetical protein